MTVAAADAADAAAAADALSFSLILVSQLVKDLSCCYTLGFHDNLIINGKNHHTLSCHFFTLQTCPVIYCHLFI